MQFNSNFLSSYVEDPDYRLARRLDWGLEKNETELKVYIQELKLCLEIADNHILKCEQALEEKDDYIEELEAKIKELEFNNDNR